MKGSTLFWLGAGGLAAFLLYEKFKGPAAAAANAVEGAIATVYETLTFAAPIQVAGSVDDLKGNLLGPISSFPAAHDSQGNTYLQIHGAAYQLGPRDARGNFTAIPTRQAAG